VLGIVQAAKICLRMPKDQKLHRKARAPAPQQPSSRPVSNPETQISHGPLASADQLEHSDPRARDSALDVHHADEPRPKSRKLDPEDEAMGAPHHEQQESTAAKGGFLLCRGFLFVRSLLCRVSSLEGSFFIGFLLWRVSSLWGFFFVGFLPSGFLLLGFLPLVQSEIGSLTTGQAAGGRSRAKEWSRSSAGAHWAGRQSISASTSAKKQKARPGQEGGCEGGSGTALDAAARCDPARPGDSCREFM
jgi:hypothetical protein